MSAYFSCVKVFLESDSTPHSRQTGIKRFTNRLDRRNIQLINQIFHSLCHVDIVMDNSELIIGLFVLAIIPFRKGKPKFSTVLEGFLSDEAKKDIRKWIIDYSYLAEDWFAVQYHKNRFKL